MKIKSLKFWIGALSLAAIPVLIIDIAHHTVDWTKDVHNEILSLVYNQEAFNNIERKEMSDDIFSQNQSLGLQIVLKPVLCIILLIIAIYFLRRYLKESKQHFLKPSLLIASSITLFVLIKVFLVPRLIFNSNIHFAEYEPEKETFEVFRNKNFKGKVMYVDFWGTYCGPCLKEFKHSTTKLKQRYSSNKKVEFLYICGGDEIRHGYMWREQIKKYNVEGNHIFLNWGEYDKLYRYLIADNKAEITAPRYLIIDADGKVISKDAPRPSDKEKLYAQIDKSLIN